MVCENIFKAQSFQNKQIIESCNFERMFTPHRESHVTCHESHVTCHVSHVTCHVSHVTCHMSFFVQNVGASQWRVCYQPGLSHLVFTQCKFKTQVFGGAKHTKSKKKKNLQNKFPEVFGYVTIFC